MCSLLFQVKVAHKHRNNNNNSYGWLQSTTLCCQNVELVASILGPVKIHLLYSPRSESITNNPPNSATYWPVCSRQHFQSLSQICVNVDCFNSLYENTEKHFCFWCQCCRVNVASDPALTHSITGSIAAILSVRICSSPFVTSFKAGPELLANTT